LEPEENEFPPLADDESMPTPPADEFTQSPEQSQNPLPLEAAGESAAPAEATGSATQLEPAKPAAPAETPAKKDPWAESEPAPTPEPGGISIVILGVFMAIAAAGMVFFIIQNRNLRAKIDQVSAEALQAKTRAAQLQAQLDHLSLPNGGQSPGFLIVSAIYGSGQQFRDVTERVTVLLHQPDAEFYSKPDWLHDDPTPGWNKELMIIYNYGWHRHIYMTGEGGKVSVAILADAAK
jgi:hypothetical protein